MTVNDIKTKKRVMRISTVGDLDVRPIYSDEVWARTVLQFKQSGDPLFPLDQFPVGGREDVRVLLAPFQIDQHLEGGTVISYFFKRGYLTDFASVPKKLRSLVDNDDPRILLAALCHDVDFGTQEMGFRSANRKFYGAIRTQGGSRYFAGKAFLAVASPFGRICYNKYKKLNRFQEIRKFARIRVTGKL